MMMIMMDVSTTMMMALMRESSGLFYVVLQCWRHADDMSTHMLIRIILVLFYSLQLLPFTNSYVYSFSFSISEDLMIFVDSVIVIYYYSMYYYYYYVYYYDVLLLSLLLCSYDAFKQLNWNFNPKVKLLYPHSYVQLQQIWLVQLKEEKHKKKIKFGETYGDANCLLYPRWGFQQAWI